MYATDPNEMQMLAGEFESNCGREIRIVYPSAQAGERIRKTSAVPIPSIASVPWQLFRHGDGWK